MYQFWLFHGWLFHGFQASVACPASCLDMLRTPLLQSAQKSTFSFPNMRKSHSKHSKMVLFFSKQLSNCYQSKDCRDCGSHLEVYPSGLSSLQSETRYIYIFFKVLYFPMNLWINSLLFFFFSCRRPSKVLWGKKKWSMTFLLKSTARPHCQLGWIHQCAFASSSGCNRHISFVMMLPVAASSSFL